MLNGDWKLMLLLLGGGRHIPIKEAK